jgi:hypothetical protein
MQIAKFVAQVKWKCFNIAFEIILGQILLELRSQEFKYFRGRQSKTWTLDGNNLSQGTLFTLWGCNSYTWFNGSYQGQLLDMFWSTMFFFIWLKRFLLHFGGKYSMQKHIKIVWISTMEVKMATLATNYKHWLTWDPFKHTKIEISFTLKWYHHLLFAHNLPHINGFFLCLNTTSLTLWLNDVLSYPILVHFKSLCSCWTLINTLCTSLKTL